MTSYGGEALIIASGPITHEGGGIAGRRIVLRDQVNQYVVHTQRFYEDGSTAFDNGNYFPVRNDPVKARLEAWACFIKRASALVEDYDYTNPNVDVVRYRKLLHEES